VGSIGGKGVERLPSFLSIAIVLQYIRFDCNTNGSPKEKPGFAWICITIDYNTIEYICITKIFEKK